MSLVKFNHIFSYQPCILKILQYLDTSDKIRFFRYYNPINITPLLLQIEIWEIPGDLEGNKRNKLLKRTVECYIVGKYSILYFHAINAMKMTQKKFKYCKLTQLWHASMQKQLITIEKN